jgi:hypothetical protein
MGFDAAALVGGLDEWRERFGDSDPRLETAANRVEEPA